MVSRVLAGILGSDHILCLDGLFDKDLECGEVMEIQLATKSRIESLAEPLLLLGVGGDLLGSIAGKTIALPTKLINGPSSLGEIAELLSLAVHESLRNVMLAKSITELIPRSQLSSWTHVQKVLPPRASCNLEVVRGIVDSVTIYNMSRMELSLDAAKPVIGVKGLSGIVENWGMKPDKFIQQHKLIQLLGSVSSNDPQQLMRVPSVSFNLHENLSYRG